MTTPPTDPKALAEEVLALAKLVSWEACFGPGKYAIHAEKENCHKLFWGVDELARAVLALDEENRKLKERLLVEEGAFSHTSAKKAEIEAENQRLRTALEKIATKHIAYSDVSNTQYDIGVVDGHRCAANIAREALERKP